MKITINSCWTFFLPYHQFVDMVCRVAISNECISADLVSLSAMLAVEGVSLHLPIFPKLWLDIIHSEVGQEFIQLLCNSSYFIDYMESVLLDERSCLNHPVVFQLFSVLLPKVSSQVINDQMLTLVSSLMTSFVKSFEETNITKQAHKVNGDLRALYLIFSVEQPHEVPKEFIKIMNRLIEHCNQLTKTENCNSSNCKEEKDVKEDGEIEEKVAVSLKAIENQASPTTSTTDSSMNPSKRQRLNSSSSDKDDPSKKPPNETAEGEEDPAEVLLKSASALLATLQPQPGRS